MSCCSGGRWWVSVDRPAIALPGSMPRVVRQASNIVVDLGSPASTDMTYTEAADIYLGDVSSQVYEFLRRPRPCVFLDPRRRAWEGDADFLHWRAGPVVNDVDHLEAALDAAQAEYATRYAPIQRELFAYTFDLTATPSSQRAAAAILAMLNDDPAAPNVSRA